MGHSGAKPQMSCNLRMLYILISVWVLLTPQTQVKMYFHHVFDTKIVKSKKNQEN